LRERQTDFNTDGHPVVARSDDTSLVAITSKRKTSSARTLDTAPLLHRCRSARVWDSHAAGSQQDLAFRVRTQWPAGGWGSMEWVMLERFGDSHREPAR
jgi:hypothetical protein